jgi:UDP-N-acetyl-D-glucosamine/UDP-N-acetyl-D-galactosamine dehydrogenase
MKRKIAVVGLGYVGLPVALAFGKIGTVIGFDLSKKRISELSQNCDSTGEVESHELQQANIEYTSNSNKLREADFIIIAVPTPIDKAKKPNLQPLQTASKIVARNMVPGTVVVYESTVYPGVTEDICVPILELESGLKMGCDFKVGYSPERINPGDRNHTFAHIKKVVSGSDEATLAVIAEVYGNVIGAGIYKASSIMAAEAAKVIENTQRDLNMALMNELSVLFRKMGIDTKDVLEAAGTKWNFLPFEPGLVGGHCIGVDPYYLTFKAEELDYHPQVILAGRRINDYMGKYVAEETIKCLIKAGGVIKNSNVLIMGFSYKEDVSDFRNTRVLDIYNELKTYGLSVDVYDPLVDVTDVLREHGISILETFRNEKRYDAVIVAVKHRQFNEMNPESLKRICRSDGNPVLVDVKGIYGKKEAEALGLMYWRL